MLTFSVFPFQNPNFIVHTREHPIVTSSMEKTEKTDNLLFEDLTHTDQINTPHIEAIKSTSILPGIALNTLSKYLLVILTLVGCFLLLLWSRLDINETNVALGNAQDNYRAALEENHRLQLELNLLLDPASIERQIEDWDLEQKLDTIDIYEVE